MLFSTTFAVLGLVMTSQAHMIMNTPVPFQLGSEPQAPLAEDGSDFPCKTPGSYIARGPSTPMGLGSSQPLSFTGSAVHGGGSCQISITYDKAPTANSVWKVIHSIHGGCPMRGIDGNNGNDANRVSPSMYSFTIPNELPTGEAVLAWTWFNKVGNREMYMNCAPITITGGATRRDESALESRNATELVQRDVAAFNSLPNMFKANIGNCKTVEGINLIFPDPGSSVEKNNDNKPFDAPPQACLASNGGSGSPSVPAPSASQVTSAPASTATATKTTLPGGVFITVRPPQGTSSATAAPTSSPPAATSPVEAPVPTQATTFTVVPTKATSAAPPAGTGTVGVLSGPCSNEGQWNCIGGSSFQQCGSGSWSTPQQLAAGTKCAPGQSNAIDIQAIGAKRNLRFSGAHLRRHLRSS